MSDFEEFVAAFQRGQVAAENAQSAKAEIDAVIRALSAQISAATDGKIEIKSIEFRNSVGGILDLTRSAMDPLGVTRPADDKSQWIAARNPHQTNASWVRLAKWVRPHTGYPCTILYNTQEVRCHDLEALERGISSMLADAWVGEKLHSLLTDSNKPQPTT
jgi:hypothetical protein